MPASSPTQTAWSRRIPLVLAGAVAVLGALILFGWWFRIPALVQGIADWTPVTPATALGFVILGALLLSQESGTRRAGWLALVPAAIGAFSLVEDLTGRSFGVEGFVAYDFTGYTENAPARMSPAVSISLLAIGLATAGLTHPWFTRRRTLVLAIIGSLVFALGAASLAGHGLGLHAVVHWSLGAPTPPLAAAGLTLLGLAILNLAWRESVLQNVSPPAWLPLPAVVGSLTLTLILWVGLQKREMDYLDSTTQNAVNSLAAAVNLELQTQANLVDRIARRWSRVAGNELVWEVDATTQMAEAPACIAVSLVRLDGTTEWLHATAGSGHRPDFDHNSDPARAAALGQAQQAGAPVLSATVSQGIAGPGFAIYAPVYREGEVAAFVVGEYDYLRTFSELVAQRLKLLPDYRCRIEVGGAVVFESGGFDRPRDELARGIDASYHIFGRRVRLGLAPSAEFVRRQRRYLPEVALLAGFGISLLLGLSVHLARAAYTSLRTAERSNRRLQAENEERRRVEAMLKVSDERLRLALDSTQIATFEWNLASNQIYHSPGLWTMLGHQQSRIASGHEDWLQLVHEDDLPAYRAAVERQLAGDVTFIDPEYRVRSGAGEWRWLYARAKTVARAPNGEPLRIIGTLQDVTARKRSEAALRESQAESRKLSFVASRTDNLVIIGRPDGTIDWVNESFTRVLEYQLDEIRGRTPETFLAGPETNPRTVRRIAAAMAGGIGVTCDVATYSKSGRKYHVHLEIQPVRNEAGEVETFIAILADITARVSTEQALRRAKQEADHASRAKSEFLASMSHEIRTPMNGVIGMTSLLLETGLDTEQRDFVNTIRTSGEALLTIINDILDFSKIESGRMELEHQPFDLPVCVEEALDLFAMQAAAKKLDLAYHVHDDVPPSIVGDITRLRQILVNLVNNAVKFTPNGSISVTVRRLPRDESAHVLPHQVALEFSIADTGIGIPKDRIDRLFKPFSQVDSSTTRKFGGTGLGLAICHRLAHLMGGGIRVESELGEGSRFIVTLVTEAALGGEPAAAFSAPERLRAGYVLGLEDSTITQRRLAALFRQWGVDYRGATSASNALQLLHQNARPALVIFDHDVFRSPDGEQVVSRIDEYNLPTIFVLPPGHSYQYSRFQRPYVVPLNKPLKTASLVRCIQTALGTGNPSDAPRHAAQEPQPLADRIPLDVLLVEDNAVNQKVALRFLDRLGYRADAVGNGLEAVTAVGTRRFDLLLMDLQMPEMDGFEASRRIRAQFPADRQPKIVALTANALQGDRELCLAAGMDDYITKPVKMNDLSEVIHRQFGPPSGEEQGAGSKGQGCVE